MDDDNSDWLNEVEEEIAAETPAVEAAEGAPVEGEAAAGDAPQELAYEPPPKREKPKKPVAIPVDPDRPKHPLANPNVQPPEYTYYWVRPQFLNYKYVHDYRQVYYDDVIDYLDKRNRGLERDIPRAQEWGERIFRVYTRNKSSNFITEATKARDKDVKLLSNMDTSAKFYRHHSNAYVHLTYSKYLYNAV